jgi:hypothetical protein
MHDTRPNDTARQTDAYGGGRARVRARTLRCRFSAGGACQSQRVVIGCKRNWQITGATQRLRGTAWLSPLVVAASFQLISSASGFAYGYLFYPSER